MGAGFQNRFDVLEGEEKVFKATRSSKQKHSPPI